MALESGVLAAVASRALPGVVSVGSVRVSKIETPDVPFLDDRATLALESWPVVLFGS